MREVSQRTRVINVGKREGVSNSGVTKSQKKVYVTKLNEDYGQSTTAATICGVE